MNYEQAWNEQLAAAEALKLRLAEVEKQRDVAIKHIAGWCVAIDRDGGGWDSWDHYYKAAFYREQDLPEIRQLLNQAIEAEQADY